MRENHDFCRQLLKLGMLDAKSNGCATAAQEVERASVTCSLIGREKHYFVEGDGWVREEVACCAWNARYEALIARAKFEVAS